MCTYQYSGNVGISGKFIYLDHPLLDVLETHGIGHIKHNDDTQSSPVTASQDRSVSLLSTSVPHLHLHLLVVDHRLPGPDVHPDGGDEVVGAGVIKKFVQ